jgi:CheY-like chemotaxis protein
MEGALILDEDSRSRSVLQGMLQRLGFRNVRSTGDIANTDSILHEFPSGVSLIIASDSATGGLDIPLSRYIIQKREFDLTALILTSNQWLAQSTVKFSKKYSRIDEYLHKPFNAIKLRESIAHAFHARANLRNTLVAVTSAHLPAIADAVFNPELETHWQTIAQAENVVELQNLVQARGFRIGGIVLDPELCSEPVCEFLVSFKKTALGAQTPILVLGKGADEMRKLRAFSNVFITLPESPVGFDWSAILLLLSRRLVVAWEAKQLMQAGKAQFAAENFKAANEISVLSLKIDLARWEFLEFAGEIAFHENRKSSAVDAFLQVLKTNPFSPLPYLRLSSLLEGSDRQEVEYLASQYCSAHPQVLAMLESRKRAA